MRKDFHHHFTLSGYLRRAKIAEDLLDVEDAQKSYFYALQKKRDDPDLLRKLGDRYLDAMEYKMAKKYYIKALNSADLNPNITLPHEVMAKIRIGLAKIERYQGNYKEALHSCSQALRIYREWVGDDLQTAALTTEMGNCFQAAGKTQEALNSYEGALNIYKREITSKKKFSALLKIADLLYEMGLLRSVLGEYTYAMDSYLQALELEQSYYGKETDHWCKRAREARKFTDENNSVQVALALHDLGRAFLQLKDFEKALPILRQAWSVYHECYGEKHPIMGLLLHHGGMALSGLGRFKEAIKAERKALELLESAYGDLHPSRSEMFESLGKHYENLGDHKEAILCFEKAFTIAQTISEPMQVKPLCFLGKIFWAQNEVERAKEFYHKALRICEKPSREQVGILTEMSTCLLKRGERKEAISLAKEALAVARECSEEVMAEALTHWAALSSQLGREEKAFAFSKEAFSIYKSLYGDKHFFTIRASALIAKRLHGLGKTQEAIAWAEGIFESFALLSHHCSPCLATFLSDLGRFFSAIGQNQKALGYQIQALGIMEEFFKDGHLEIVPILQELAHNFLVLGESEIAEKKGQEALVLCRRYYGETHPQHAYVLHTMGDLFLKQRKHKKALRYYEKAIIIGFHTAALFNSLGRAYQGLGEKKKAWEAMESAEHIYKENFEDESQGFAEIAYSMAVYWKELKDFRRALFFAERALKVCGKERYSFLVLIYCEFGDIFWRLKQLEEAKNAYQDARKIAEEFFPEDIPVLFKAKLSTKLGTVMKRESDLLKGKKMMRSLGFSGDWEDIKKLLKLPWESCFYHGLRKDNH